MEIRAAGPEDAEAIAELHAASWRSAYRGMFSDAYLDGDVVAERKRHWARRLAETSNPAQGVFVAVEDGRCAGFICIFLDREPAWGPLLDNLHVRPDLKGRGIGQQLIQAGVGWMRTLGPFDRWHLWVLEENAPARRVYEHLGWEPRERATRTAPDGASYQAWRYVHPF